MVGTVANMCSETDTTIHDKISVTQDYEGVLEWVLQKSASWTDYSNFISPPSI